ncbi:DUF3761 domain-containing protein [Massilia sp. S19_KUP03_FR1]|uniref:DUF3761 domain-containing protein n=1 Tax=Massilia sp. S19_KUP03_FR1 TaxID=3025503 RepID=UPI002FCDC67E
MLMKLLTAAVFALAVAIPTAHAQRQSTPPSLATSTSAPVSRAEPDERALQSHDHYQNTDGQTVHSPAKAVENQIPDGASAKCRDGTYSFSQHRRGTCSHHGGVSSWL